MIAVCPGSFDPVTSGHLDIINRASSLFDEVIVAVAINPRKTPSFSIDERMDFIRRSSADIENVSIDSFDKLLVDFCKQKKARIIVKGIRAVSDFEYEFMMAQMNLTLESNIETVFFMADPKYAYLSSSAVREIAQYGGSIKGLVPENIEKDILSKL